MLLPMRGLSALCRRPTQQVSKYKQTIGESVFHGRQKIFWRREFKGRILDLWNFKLQRERKSSSLKSPSRVQPAEKSAVKSPAVICGHCSKHFDSLVSQPNFAALAFSSSSSIIPDRSAFICRNGCRGTKWFSLQILLRDPGNRQEKIVPAFVICISSPLLSQNRK